LQIGICGAWVGIAIKDGDKSVGKWNYSLKRAASACNMRLEATRTYRRDLIIYMLSGRPLKSVARNQHDRPDWAIRGWQGLGLLSTAEEVPPTDACHRAGTDVPGRDRFFDELI